MIVQELLEKFWRGDNDSWLFVAKDPETGNPKMFCRGEYYDKKFMPEGFGEWEVIHEEMTNAEATVWKLENES